LKRRTEDACVGNKQKRQHKEKVVKEGHEPPKQWASNIREGEFMSNELQDESVYHCDFPDALAGNLLRPAFGDIPPRRHTILVIMATNIIDFHRTCSKSREKVYKSRKLAYSQGM